MEFALKNDTDQSQRYDSVVKFTASSATVAKKRPRHRKPSKIKKSLLSPVAVPHMFVEAKKSMEVLSPVNMVKDGIFKERKWNFLETEKDDIKSMELQIEDAMKKTAVEDAKTDRKVQGAIKKTTTENTIKKTRRNVENAIRKEEINSIDDIRKTEKNAECAMKKIEKHVEDALKKTNIEDTLEKTERNVENAIRKIELSANDVIKKTERNVAEAMKETEIDEEDACKRTERMTENTIKKTERNFDGTVRKANVKDVIRRTERNVDSAIKMPQRNIEDVIKSMVRNIARNNNGAQACYNIESTSEKSTKEWMSVADFHRSDMAGNTISDKLDESEKCILPGSGKVKDYVQRFNDCIKSNENEIEGKVKAEKPILVKHYLESDIDSPTKFVDKKRFFELSSKGMSKRFEDLTQGKHENKNEPTSVKIGIQLDTENVLKDKDQNIADRKQPLVSTPLKSERLPERSALDTSALHVTTYSSEESKCIERQSQSVINSTLESNISNPSDGPFLKANVACSRDVTVLKSEFLRNEVEVKSAESPNGTSVSGTQVADVDSETEIDAKMFEKNVLVKNSKDDSVINKTVENLPSDLGLIGEGTDNSKQLHQNKKVKEKVNNEEKPLSEINISPGSETLQPVNLSDYLDDKSVVSDSSICNATLFSGNAAYLSSFVRKNPGKRNIRLVADSGYPVTGVISDDTSCGIESISTDAISMKTSQVFEHDKYKSNISEGFANKKVITPAFFQQESFKSNNSEGFASEKTKNAFETDHRNRSILEDGDFNSGNTEHKEKDLEDFSKKVMSGKSNQSPIVWGDLHKDELKHEADHRDVTTVEVLPTPNESATGPKEHSLHLSGISSSCKYPASSYSGDDHGRQYATPVWNRRGDERPADACTQPAGCKSDDSIERRGSHSGFSGVSCQCSFHATRGAPISGNNSIHRINRTSESNQSYFTGLSEGPVCRICQEGDEQEVLVSPCYCAGSLGLLHVSCLQKWLGASNKTSCEICNFEFMVERKPMPISQFIRNPGTVADRKNIICDLVSVSLISPLTVATAYLCVKGAMKYYTEESWERTGLLSLSGLLIGLYLIWLVVMLKHNYNLWKDWKMFHQEVTLLAAPKMNVAKKSQKVPSMEPTGSIRSRSTVASAVEKVQLQCVKISVCGPIGRHTPKGGFGSPRLSPAPGSSQKQTKTPLNLPPSYHSPCSSKLSARRSSHSLSSSSDLSKYRQTHSKCSVLSPVPESHHRHDYDSELRAEKEQQHNVKLGGIYPLQATMQSLRGDVRQKYLVRGEDLGRFESSPQRSQQQRYSRPKNLNDQFEELNGETSKVGMRDRRFLRSEREKSSESMKRKNQGSYVSPMIHASQVEENFPSSPENSELSSVVCVFKTPQKEKTSPDRKRQKMEKKSLAGFRQITNSEIFSGGSSPAVPTTGTQKKASVYSDLASFQQERSEEPVQFDTSTADAQSVSNVASVSGIQSNRNVKRAVLRNAQSQTDWKLVKF